MMRTKISNINHYSGYILVKNPIVKFWSQKLSKRISVKMILMTQKQFFSLFISCMIVVSKYTIIATECYQCDSAHHENCTLDWTEEDVRGNTYDQYIQQCTSLCTQKIGNPLTISTKLYKSFFLFQVFENDSVNIWRYCEVTTFNGCNDQKVLIYYI